MYSIKTLLVKFAALRSQRITILWRETIYYHHVQQRCRQQHRCDPYAENYLLRASDAAPWARLQRMNNHCVSVIREQTFITVETAPITLFVEKFWSLKSGRATNWILQFLTRRNCACVVDGLLTHCSEAGDRRRPPASLQCVPVWEMWICCDDQGRPISLRQGCKLKFRRALFLTVDQISKKCCTGNANWDVHSWHCVLCKVSSWSRLFS